MLVRPRGRRAPASLELVIAALVIALLVGVPLGLVVGPLAGPGRRPRDPGRLGPRRLDAGLLAGADPAARLRPAAAPAAGGRRVLPEPASSATRSTVRTGFGLIDAPDHRQLADVRQHARPPRAARASWSPPTRPGVIARMVRAAVLDTVGEDHVRMVRALGFPERTVFGRFALRLAWNPVAAVRRAGVRLLAGQHVPGRGDLRLARARQLRGGVDRQRSTRPAILGVTLFVAIVYVVANLVVDIVQAAHRPEDPAADDRGARHPARPRGATAPPRPALRRRAAARNPLLAGRRR